MEENNPFLINKEIATYGVIDAMRRIKSEITLHNGRAISFISFSADELVGTTNLLDSINLLCKKGLVKKLVNQSDNAGVSMEITDESAFENYYNLITKNYHHEDKRDFWFDDSTFYLKITGSDPKTINFSPTSTRGTNCYYFMKAIIALLKREGVRDGKWLIADFQRSDVIEMISQLFEKGFNTDWVDDTKGNWKKIVPKDWKGYIELSDFNRSNKGYKLKLKMPD